jgi:hypothetical protein
VTAAVAYRGTAIGLGRRGLGGYFNGGAALASPRLITTFVIIFRWNRARFSVARRALLVRWIGVGQ